MTFKSAIYISIYLVTFIWVIKLFFYPVRSYNEDKILNIFLCIRSVIKFILNVLYGAVILLGIYYCELFGIVNIFSLCILISILFISKIVLNKFIDKRID
ncbi:MAG: hypothetical protein NSGCLCUN01_03159 [uncultured Clostridium sp.]